MKALMQLKLNTGRDEAKQKLDQLASISAGGDWLKTIAARPSNSPRTPWQSRRSVRQSGKDDTAAQISNALNKLQSDLDAKIKTYANRPQEWIEAYHAITLAHPGLVQAYAAKFDEHGRIERLPNSAKIPRAFLELQHTVAAWGDAYEETRRDRSGTECHIGKPESTRRWQTSSISKIDDLDHAGAVASISVQDGKPQVSDERLRALVASFVDWVNSTTEPSPQIRKPPPQRSMEDMD